MKKIKKIFAWVSILSLLLQISGGIFIYRPVLAEEEATPTPEITPSAEPTLEPTPTIEPAPNAEPTPSIEPEATAAPTPTEEVAPAPIIEDNQPASENSAPPTQTGPPAAENQTPSEPSTPTDVTPTENGHLNAVILENVKADSVSELDLEYQTEGSATLKTDKLDYAPTDTVVITGNGFNANETYTLIISSTNEPPVNFETQITADENGTFVYAYQLDGIYRPNYKVKAKDEDGKIIAETTFTDTPVTTIESFAVLGGSTVTNTGLSVINGDLGVWPGTAITGFYPSGIVNGTIHAGDGPASEAQADLTNVYNNKARLSCDTVLTGQDLGGMTLQPGVYCFSSSAQLTGPLVLNGLGDPNAVFVFQIGSTLTTASSSNVTLINGAQACNIFWQVGSSATLDTNTHFEGNILALASVTLNTGATVNGRALARNAAVTLDSNIVTKAVCSTGPFAYCGDSSVNQQFEQCDDGNQNNDDYCTNGCQFNRACLPDVNMVVNGGFETPVISASQGWDILPSGTLGLGWLVEWYGGFTSYGGATRPDIANLELHRGVNGWTSQEGSQHAELDTDWNDHSGSLDGEPASVKISQTLPTIPGYRYEIKYAFSPRPNESAADNKLQSWWGGVGLGNHQSAGGSNTSWTPYTFEQVATANTTTLEFADQGTPNSLGTFIDNVSVKCLGPVTGNIQVGKEIDKDGNGTYEDLTNSVGFKWGYDAENPVRNMATVASNVPYGIHTVTESTNSDYYFTGWYSKKNQNTHSCANPEGTTYPISITVSADADASAIILCNAKNPTCGDGIKNGTEQCDGTDGVTAGQNFCSTSCHLVPIYDGAHTCPANTVPVQVGGPYDVYGNDADGINVSVTPDGKYLFEALGTFIPTGAPGYLSDAGYTWVNGLLSTMYGIHGTPPDYAAHALLSDFGTGVVGVVDWGNTNLDHIYTKYYEPTTSSVQFLIGDRYADWFNTPYQNQTGMGDNSGSLSLNVYECQNYGHLIVQKTTIPAGDPTTFNVYVTGSGTITGNPNGPVSDSLDKDYEVTSGTYSVTETGLDDWEVTGNTCQNVVVGSGETKYCTITNTKKGSIALGKCNDINGDGGECEGSEPMLPGWTLFLDENDDGVLNGGERSGVTDSQGMVNFSNVLPRNYGLCEVQQSGWMNTKSPGINCHGVTLNPGGWYCLLLC